MRWIKRLNNYGMSNWIILLLFILSLLSMLAQMIGLGIFLPIFEFIFQNDAAKVESNQSLLLTYINQIIKAMNVSLNLGSLLIVAFGFYLFSQIVLFLIAYANAYYLGELTQKNRNKFFEFYLNADSEYYDQVKIGDFINTSTTELGNAVVGVIAPIKLMVALVSSIGSIMILLMLSYELTLYIVLIILLILPYPMILVNRTIKVGRRHSKFNSLVVSFLLDRLRSPRLVRLSGTKKSEIREYSKITETQRIAALEANVLKEKVGVIFEPAIVFASLIVLFIAITFLNMSSSSVVLFMVITVRLVPIVRNILAQKQSINRTKGSIEAIDSLLFDMQEKDTKNNFLTDNKHEIKSINKIQLNNVFYRYSDTESYSLSDVSITFNRNSLNAIIGPSGSGKSTLIDIISTYRKPKSGKVFFDGMLYKDSQINTLISYVPQQPQIFDGEIIEHISYGLKNKSLSDVKMASELSGAHNFIIKLENGYQTLLSNNGDNLSGGQRYRLDMARAILSNSPILILDEPTSALDYESKNNFITTLNKIKKETQKIVIVITHDFSITSYFDSIVMLEEGRVYLQSDHDDLLSKSEWYQNGVNSANGLKNNETN